MIIITGNIIDKHISSCVSNKIWMQMENKIAFKVYSKIWDTSINNIKIEMGEMNETN